MNAIMVYLDSIPRLVLILFALALFGTAVRWNLRPTLLIDGALIAGAVNELTIGALAWCAVVIAIRHVPALASDLAQLIDLESYEGLSRYLLMLLLPGAIPHERIMSRSDAAQTIALSPAVVHVPIPGTAGTKAELPPDRDITKAGWIDIMASARGENGKFLFSGNTIFKAIGGHRATVLARVKEIQTGAAPAQFRTEDGQTAPADYPVSAGSEDRP